MKELSQARKLINECLKNQTTFLDLGNCGITNLGDLPELFECTHLKTLILSNKWYDKTQKKDVNSKNNGSLNNIEYITQDIAKLKNLQNFKIGGAFHFFTYGYLNNKWHIKDISFLKNLTALNSLDLSSNQISDISFLKNLTALNSLSLSSNQISDISFLKNLTALNSLDLSYNQISDISFLKNLTALNSLSLSSNQISDISFLKNLTALNSLDLSDNQISDYSFLKNLTALNSLDLRSNKISDYSFLKNLTALNSLDLSDNQISDYSFLKNLTALNSLDLSDNQISDISFLKNLTALNSLDLSYNQISDISFLKNLTALNSLDLSSNKISDYSFLKNLTALNSLSLSYNQISDISFLKNLTALNSLDLSDNQISDISFLKNLTALNSLSLSYNQISDISFLKNLTALNSLSLSYNQISDYSFLKNLTALNSLSLSSNQISDISFLKNLTALNSLDLSNNQILDISFLKNLTALNSLSLRNNQISDYSFLKNLTALKSLDLSNNQISDYSFLKNLTALNSLSLRNNQISDISSLKNLTALDSLDLRSNQISELPIWITDFKIEITLEEYSEGIQLYKNPLQKPPAEIVNQGKDAVKRYFKELEREDVKEIQLFEAKVLLLGEGKTGKTSLRIKLEDETKPLPNDDERTRGINIYKYKFPINDDTFISHIWDFGGQDILYQVHRFFLSDDALYILLTDSRADQGNKYEEWLQTIEIFTSKNNNQIILLQNLKYGDTPASIDIAEYKKHYSIVNGKVYEIDLSFSENKHLQEFRQFRQIIEHRLFELPHVQKPILSHWLAVRKELETKLVNNINLIKLSEYTQICRENKLDNTESQKDLLRYLHRLGVVLWYEDYPAVKQKVILNPEWVTTALYRIIDSTDIRNKNGKLDQCNIENLWDEAIYEDYHSELLEILKIFRLAYKRKQEHAYIVPSLMNNAVPQKYERWNPENKWIIKYRYPRLMPRGIVNQLAAELCRHIESDFDDVWAFGVVFTTENAKAKVQENRNRKQIEVEAYGDERLSLMQNIVKALEDIHNTYKGLEYEIEIPCICEKCNESTDSRKTYFDYYRDIMLEINDNREDIYCRNLRQTIKIAPILERSGFALPYKLTELLKGRERAYKKREDGIERSLSSIENTTKKTLGNTEEIVSTLNNYFDNLLQLSKNSKLQKTEIIAAVQEISDKQKEDVFNDMIEILTAHHEDMDENLKEIYNRVKKSGDNLEMKIKAFIPILNILGVDIGIEGKFDIRKWSKKMYEKYELQLFKLFGYVSNKETDKEHFG